MVKLVVVLVRVTFGSVRVVVVIHVRHFCLAMIVFCLRSAIAVVWLEESTCWTVVPFVEGCYG